MELNPFSYIALTAFFLNLLLASYLFMTNPRNRARRVFIATLALLALANLADFFLRNTMIVPDSAAVFKIIYSLLVLATFFLLHFSMIFLNKNLPKFLYGFPIAFIAVTLLTDLFLTSTAMQTPYGPEAVFGPLASLLFIYFVAVTLSALYYLHSVHGQIRAKLMRKKLFFLIVGAALVTILSIVSAFAPVFQLEPYPLFPVASSMGALFMSYAFLIGGGK